MGDLAMNPRDAIRDARASKMTRYWVELWSRDGDKIADITPYVRNLYFAEERNEAEELQFSMDLDVFEAFMAKAGADPVSNFREGQTEIKVREQIGSQAPRYRFGTQLYYAPIDLNNDGSITVSVRGTGYLNFFNARYPDPSIAYTNTEAVEIFYGLVKQAQAVPNGNYGVIVPTGGYYTTGKLRTRTYELYTSTTKLNMQRLTELVDGRFDFKFLPDKTLMTYSAVGSPRTDFSIDFDRTNFRSKLVSARLNRGANNLYNQIIALGSGFGTGDTIYEIVNDIASQVEFRLRQSPVQFNEVKERDTLILNAQTRLEKVKKLLRMPQITLNGADMPVVPLEVGDIFPLIMRGRRLLEDLTGYYRVERMETHVDENHFQQAVTLYFEKTGDYAA